MAKLEHHHSVSMKQYLEGLIDKVINFLDKHIPTSKHPQNIYYKGGMRSRQELGLTDDDMDNIQKEIKKLAQQREDFGVKSDENPLDVSDRLIERATDSYVNKILKERAETAKTKTKREF